MGPSPQSGHSRPNHLPALDGVRLLAVGLVIVHHLTSGKHTSLFRHIIGLQRGNGLGPPLFFVLSGALLTTVILDARNSENRYRNFVLRRILRIFPLYFGYLALAIIATWFVTGALPHHFWVFALFAQNLFPDLASHTGSVLHTYHLWTISVQDQFYLLWPLLLWRFNSNRALRWLCWSGIALSVVSRAIILSPAITTARYGRLLPAVAGCMCLGGLIALERRERTILTPILLRGFLPFSLLCTLWMWFGLDFNSISGSLIGYQLVAFACAGMVATAMQPASYTARILGSKLFATGGKKYAFAMYMFHPCLLNFFLTLPLLHSRVLELALFLVTTVVLSGLSYRYIESYFLHLPVGRTRNPAPQPTSQPQPHPKPAPSLTAPATS